MILYENTYKREGIDIRLIDWIKILQDSSGLYLYHKKRWNVLIGRGTEYRTIELDKNDLEKSQTIIDNHLYLNSLNDIFNINVNNLLTNG